MIPAIIPKDFTELEEKIELVKGVVPLVQVDVMDGRYTPQASWPYKKQDENFAAIIDESRGMPFWEEVDFEVDLMVNEPEKIIEDWVRAGATRIIVHFDSTNELPLIIDTLKNIVEIGVALGIHTDISKIAPFISSIDFIQCMGIERIGFQGQPFDERVLEKIADLRAHYPDLPISVDGGVSIETAPRLVDAGATRLVAGSAVYKSENHVEAIHTLQNM